MVEAKPLVSVVLSFRNEEKTLPELVRRLHSVLRAVPLQYELIFVNDDSLDHSLDVLTSEAAADARVKIVNMSRRFGVYECMLAGLSYASGDAVITMDSDLQDPPEVIPELVQKWRDGADVAYTVRLSRAGESRSKIWVTHLAYRAIRWVSDISLPVDAGDYKLMSRRVIERVLEMNEVNPYLRGLVAWVGFQQAPVYYHREPRYAGGSQRSVLFSGEPAKVFFAGIAFSSLFPMAVFLLLGIAALAAGALAILALVALSVVGVPFAGWLWMLVPMFVVSG